MVASCEVVHKKPWLHGTSNRKAGAGPSFIRSAAGFDTTAVLFAAANDILWTSESTHGLHVLMSDTDRHD